MIKEANCPPEEKSIGGEAHRKAACGAPAIVFRGGRCVADDAEVSSTGMTVLEPSVLHRGRWNGALRPQSLLLILCCRERLAPIISRYGSWFSDKLNVRGKETAVVKGWGNHTLFNGFLFFCYFVGCSINAVRSEWGQSFLNFPEQKRTSEMTLQLFNNLWDTNYILKVHSLPYFQGGSLFEYLPLTLFWKETQKSYWVQSHAVNTHTHTHIHTHWSCSNTLLYVTAPMEVHSTGAQQLCARQKNRNSNSL